MRLEVRRIHRSQPLCKRLESALVGVAGIQAVRASPITSTVLVRFDRSILPPRTLLEQVRSLSGRVCAESDPPEDPEDPEPPSRAEEGRRWHTMTADEVLGRLEATLDGLSRGEVVARRTRFGPNVLAEGRGRSPLKILLDQLTTAPVAMLGVSAALSLATGGVADALAIVAVVGLNAVIGYVTESKTEQTIRSLEEVGRGAARVLRDGEEEEIPVEDVVPGDILLLTLATVVPADARLVACQDLTVDESRFTGESVPVKKSLEPVADPRRPLADRKSMVYRSTVVTGGRGRAVVVATGRSTEIGRIQDLVVSVEQRATPLQLQLSHLGRQLVVVSSAVCGGVFLIGLIRRHAALDMLKTSVSLAVAAVPEGLPTVAVTTLALGINRMREHKVLIRHQAAVETLGAVQVMCLDKTGTITENRMNVVAGAFGKKLFEVEGETITADEATVNASSPDLARLLQVIVLCNEAMIADRAEDVLEGSPTETALLRFALRAGFDVEEERRRRPMVHLTPRSELRSLMETVHAEGDRRLLAVKGRPSEVLARCRSILEGGRTRVLTDEDRSWIETQNDRMGGRALRMLGAAYAEGTEEDHRNDLVWLGLVGIADPPRPGMRAVIRRFHHAGVRTAMITGDQSTTAFAIAKSVGLGSDGDLRILDSSRLQDIDRTVLKSLVRQAHVFSRISPADKLQIVQALQASGQVVAMTGDGVNDSPALKAADVGVAMGTSGTSAAREAADVVLQEDDLTSMITAIEQGRTIYDDIKKAVHFILATNLSEILMTFTSVAGGLGRPLNPMQLLWINLMTDVFPELALAVQPPESDVLARPPRRPNRPMFDKKDMAHLGVEGAIITASAMSAFAYGLSRYGRGRHASTIGFTSLTCAQLLHGISARSEHHSMFDREHLARNPYLWLSVGGALALQVLAALFPPARALLKIAPLRPADWAVSALAATTPLVVHESLKIVERNWRTPEVPEIEESDNA